MNKGMSTRSSDSTPIPAEPEEMAQPNPCLEYFEVGAVEEAMIEVEATTADAEESIPATIVNPDPPKKRRGRPSKPRNLESEGVSVPESEFSTAGTKKYYLTRKVRLGKLDPEEASDGDDEDYYPGPNHAIKNKRKYVKKANSLKGVGQEAGEGVTDSEESKPASTTTVKASKRGGKNNNKGKNAAVVDPENSGVRDDTESSFASDISHNNSLLEKPAPKRKSAAVAKVTLTAEELEERENEKALKKTMANQQAREEREERIKVKADVAASNVELERLRDHAAVMEDLRETMQKDVAIAVKTRGNLKALTEFLGGEVDKRMREVAARAGQ